MRVKQVSGETNCLFVVHCNNQEFKQIELWLNTVKFLKDVLVSHTAVAVVILFNSKSDAALFKLTWM